MLTNNDTNKVVNVNIDEEMRRSYIDYAMSVIVSRALPDVRDGLKPVHRRILYSMFESGYTNDKQFRKCARVVGDTMGKCHPHGDSAIYDALVNLAQDFSTRYMLIDSHGNFGSIDGDSAAAMRYTECKLSKISEELLRDLGKDTVDMEPNFDETLKEPVVLPARYPNLLANGTTGIAVGMATNIPPHNLREIIDAVLKMIDNFVENDKETDIEDLIKIVKGPDFPTGATILSTPELKKAYRTGRGIIKIRGVAAIEEHKGKDRIIITEIPYRVNKANLIEKVAELVRDKKIEGISDLRDESNREGIRIVVELKRDANANVVLNKLYKFTALQSSFGINMLALVNSEPKTLNLKQMLSYYLNHQREVETRRIKYDLKKAEDRAHILEGLRIALNNIDEIVRIIKSSKDVDTAKQELMKAFGLTEIQAQAIVDMRLKTLTGLEKEKIEAEYAELMKTITELKAILADEKKLYAVIKEYLSKIREKFGDKRRTTFTQDEGDFEEEDLIKNDRNVVTMTYLGYIKRVPVDTYTVQNRGGRGIKALEKREDDFIQNIFISDAHNHLLFFTNRGIVYKLKTYEIPEASRVARGMNIKSLLPLSADEKITAVISIKDFDESKFLLMATKNGIVKKSQLSNYQNIRKTGIIGINLRDDDELIRVCITNGNEEIVLATHDGFGIRFKEEDVRVIGRSGTGVTGIKLREKDVVVGMEVLAEDKKILVITKRGLGKVFKQDGISLQKRAGKGVKIHKVTEKTGSIVGMRTVHDIDEIMIINSIGVIIRLKIENISEMGRVTQGVKLINLEKDVEVSSVAKIQLDESALEVGIGADDDEEENPQTALNTNGDENV